jgi:hypothetical protein
MGGEAGEVESRIQNSESRRGRDAGTGRGGAEIIHIDI